MDRCPRRRLRKTKWRSWNGVNLCVVVYRVPNFCLLSIEPQTFCFFQLSVVVVIKKNIAFLDFSRDLPGKFFIVFLPVFGPKCQKYTLFSAPMIELQILHCCLQSPELCWQKCIFVQTHIADYIGRRCSQNIT